MSGEDDLWASSWRLDELGLPGLPKRAENINRLARVRGWRSRPHPGRRRARQWYVLDLPEAAQARLRELGLLGGPAAELASPVSGR